jgi:hypothetical protein
MLADLAQVHGSTILRSRPEPLLRQDLGAVASILRTRGEDVTARAWLVHVLGAQGFRPVVQDLASTALALLADPTEDPGVRCSVVRTLIPAAPPERARAALLAAVRDGDEQVQAAAYAILAGPTPPCPIAPDERLALTEAGLRGRNPGVRYLALSIAGDLAASGEPRARALVLRSFREGEASLRYFALGQIHRLAKGDPSLADELDRLPADTSLVTRIHVARVVADLRGDALRSLPILIQGLRSKEGDAWQAAMYELGRISREPAAHEAVVAAVRWMLRDPDEGTRLHAALALARVGGRSDEFRPILERGIRSSDPMARALARLTLQGPRRPVTRPSPAEKTPLLVGLLGTVGLLGGVALIGLILARIRTTHAPDRTARPGTKNLFITKHPRRIHLRAKEQAHWNDPEAIATQLAGLKELGFRDVGPFEMVEAPVVRMWALIHTDEAAVAMLQDHDERGVYVSLRTRYRDGTSFSLVNYHSPYLPPSRPDHLHVYVQVPDVRTLHERFLAERPVAPMDPITAEEFVAWYEQSAADYADWRNSRGGMTADEIRALNRSKGIEVTDAQLARLLDRLGRRALDELDVSLRERFLDREGLPEAARAQTYPNLIIVHDRLPPGWLHEMFLGLFDDEFHRARKAEAAEGGLRDEWLDSAVGEKLPPWEGLAPRLAFATLNKRLPAVERYVKVGELDWPLETDVYLPA